MRMTEPTPTMTSLAEPAAALPPRPTRARATAGHPPRAPWYEIIAYSLLITAACAAVAVVVNPLAPQDFLYAFVLVRWIAVLVVWVVPLVSRIVPAWPIPRVARTPFTALALTIESIGFDILSVHL